MQQPNWLDQKYSQQLAKTSAPDSLAILAKDPRIVQAVTDALANFDANSGKPGWAGPSRTQAIRDALANTLQAIN